MATLYSEVGKLVRTNNENSLVKLVSLDKQSNNGIQGQLHERAHIAP